MAFSYCSKSQDHFPVCKLPAWSLCTGSCAQLLAPTEQTGQHDPGQHEAHGKDCHVQLTDLSVHPGLGCVMAAAVCLVGINAVFTGGDCHPAVLQNWSLLVSAKVRWQPVWAEWAPVSPGTTASAWAHGACILPSPVVWQALPVTPTHKPLSSAIGSFVSWVYWWVLFVVRQNLTM